MGIRNPFSPARNQARTFNVEGKLIKWVRENNQMIITGHTHKHAFARPGEVLYFNSGCCTNKGYITGIEIQDGQIMMVKWSENKVGNRYPKIIREVIAGPEMISAYAASKF